jgi:hypothetical protein
VNIGSADLRPNHPYVVIGVPADLTDLETGANSSRLPVAATAVKARAQSGAVRVRIWRDVGPAAGPCVFDGLISFPDGVVRVSDLENVSVFSVRTDRIRDDGHQVFIYADDIDAASRIDVLIDADGPVWRLTAVPGYELEPVRGMQTGGLHPADELGLILDGYGRPFSRLAAAVKLLLSAPDISPPQRAPAVRRFLAEMIGEWMRGLGGPERATDALMLASQLEDRLADETARDVDGRALEVAAQLLNAAGLQVLGRDPGSAHERVET